MKKIIYLAVCVSILFVGSLRAADVPFVELEGRADEVTEATFSPDGKKIVAATGNIVRIWDTDSESTTFGKELQKLELEGEILGNSAVFGKIVTKTEDNVFHVWDANGRKLRTLNPGDDFVECGVSPGGTRIVTVYGDYRIRLWDTESGKEVRVSPRTPSLVQRAAGRRTVQALARQGITAWAVPGYAYFSPNGKKIVAMDPELANLAVQIYDAQSGRGLQILEGRNPTLSPNGNRVVMTSMLDYTIAQLWNTETGNRIANIKSADGPIVFSPDDGRFMVMQSGDVNSNTVLVFDTNSGAQLRKLNLKDPDEQTVALSSDGRRIVTENYSEEITRIVDATNGNELQKLEGRFLDFARDNRKIATISDDTIRVWTLPTAVGSR